MAGALLAALVACAGPYASPEGAVRSWLDALEASDPEGVREAFTERTRELVDEIESLSRQAEPVSGHPAITVEDWCEAFCGATVESSTLHGDSATVEIRIADDVNEIPLVRREDGWKIDLSGHLEPAVHMLRLAVREEDDPASPADTAAGTEADTAAARPR
ncbi:MAG: hypothetical protein R3326_01160 [Gemmatimonadota bacterium]|nr:hypothetical protein [Gemmatimonadota bacterium]